jgi:hypothetical protein
MNRLARNYGHMIDVQYGEAFVIKEMIKIDDIVDMPVRSV